MRKMLLALLLAIFGVAIQAQTVREEIHENPLRTASNYMAYPGPQQEVLTPAPKGYKPFFISHYGRHGSRYHTKPSMYQAPYLTLAHADSLGKLTPLGRDVMHRLDIIAKDAENRWGELTPLGAQQQMDIARRMVERFPEVFVGKTAIDARSTTVGRCIMSMEYALLQLLRMNPQLKIHHNATHRDMKDLNQQDRKLFDMKNNKAARALYRSFLSEKEDNHRLMQSLFNDTAYISRHVNASEFTLQLALIAGIIHNTPLNGKIALMDIFTEDDLYQIWLAGNIHWYIGWGACTVNNGVQPYTQRNLLRRIISDADKCIRQSRSNVQLRFGHETVLLPLICLLDINGYGLATDDLSILEEKGWINYRITPMAANLQLVFYRRSPSDSDVLFKVLLNENEATLPLNTDTPPYYRWDDFRNYYLQKLDAYQE